MSLQQQQQQQLESGHIFDNCHGSLDRHPVNVPIQEPSDDAAVPTISAVDSSYLSSDEPRRRSAIHSYRFPRQTAFGKGLVDEIHEPEKDEAKRQLSLDARRFAVSCPAVVQSQQRSAVEIGVQGSDGRGGQVVQFLLR